jgi:hypothetical protein
LLLIGSGQQHRGLSGLGQELGHDLGTLARRLPRRVDGLAGTLSEGPVVIDAGEAEIDEREPAQPSDGIVGPDRPGSDVVE